MLSKNTMIPFLSSCVVIAGFLIYIASSHFREQQAVVIAIANWGPRSSSEETIKGIKDGLLQHGYSDRELCYEIFNVDFDLSLFPQVMTKIKALRPSVFITIANPLSQRASNEIKDIPHIFTNVSDPVSAGIIEEEYRASENTTGASNRVDLDAFLDFVLKVLPQAQRIGILFATAEAQDRAIIKSMESAAAHHSMLVFAIPVDDMREISLRMEKLNGNVDLIYLGSSDALKPYLPAILEEAAKMKVPVFSGDRAQVGMHKVLAYFGVSQYQVGLNTADLVLQILEGSRPEEVSPIFPSLEDHSGVLSKKVALELGIKVPSDIKRTIILE